MTCIVHPWVGAYPGADAPATITSYHENTFEPLGSRDVGWDKYTVTVKNGYTLYSTASSYKADDGVASNLEGFASGGTSTTFTMQWAVGDGYVKYAIDVFAIGPKGVPVH